MSTCILVYLNNDFFEIPEYLLTQELPKFTLTNVTSSVSDLTESGLSVNIIQWIQIQTRVA